MSEAQLLSVLGSSAVLMFGVALLAWGGERLIGRFVSPPRDGAFPGHAPMGLGESLVLALRHSPWVIAVTLALSWAFTAAAESLGLELPKQELLSWLLGDSFSPRMKAMVIAFALLSAPLAEEIIFRRFLFRACLRLMPPAVAIGVSAAAFSAVHRNLAVFVPILFLGSAWAVLYRRSGRLLTPIVCHFLFNLTNVVLVFTCPELA